MIKETQLNHVSLANLTVGRTTQTELIRAAAGAGFGKVGLLLMTATAQPLQHEVIGRPDVIREIKAASKDTGVGVFDVEAFVLSPQTDIERFRPALELGAELGATHISSIGTEFADDTTFLSREQRIDLFGRLCDEAARFGLTVGVEFMMYRDIQTWRDVLAMIEAAGRANAGLILDVLHFFRAGAAPSDLLQIPPERIAYAQLSDCVAAPLPPEKLAAEARTSRLHLGEGAIPLQQMLDLLPAGLQLVIETPVATEAGFSTLERAKSAARHTTEFFQAYACAPRVQTAAHP
jgi:sugar phosphate isomerase/epimerase